MKQVGCLILDDEPLALSLIEGYVTKTPFLTLRAKCSSAVEALAAVGKGGIDIAFLDIQMPELSGMELSKILKDTFIIFTTAFEQYAVEGYKVNAVGYLLKPFSYAEFLSVASKAYDIVRMKRNADEFAFRSADMQTDNKQEEIKADEESDISKRRCPGKNIIVKADSKQIVIPLDSIIYVESDRDYVKIYIDDVSGKAIGGYLSDGIRYVMTLMSMKSMEEMLPSDSFVRVHRSYIVNVDKVHTIERGRIVFGKIYIPISDSYKADFEKVFQTRIKT